jgi:mono/diheme cytochrome c family protein
MFAANRPGDATCAVVPATRRAGGQSMKKAFAIAALAALALPLQAQDAERGKLLYETHCLSCHYERIHKRDAAHSTIRSHTALRVTVGRWAEQVKRPLSIEDTEDIAEYLNRSHYKLDK